MLTKINSQELLTGKEAREKYAGKYFMYHSKDIEDEHYGQYHRDTSLITVLFTADKKVEFMQLPPEVRRGRGISAGNHAEAEVQIGAIVYG